MAGVQHSIVEAMVIADDESGSAFRLRFRGEWTRRLDDLVDALGVPPARYLEEVVMADLAYRTRNLRAEKFQPALADLIARIRASYLALGSPAALTVEQEAAIFKDVDAQFKKVRKAG